MVTPGKDLLEKPSGVSLPPGTRAYATRINGKVVKQPEHLEWFQNSGGRLLLSYENTNIEKVLEADLDRPAVKLLGGASNKKNLLVLRNPFNMLPSAEKMLRRTRPALENDEQLLRNALDRRLNLWKSYAFLHMHPMSVTRGKFETFLFDRWVIEKGYRDSMAEKLGYKNKDLFIDFVSDAGKGSSFSGVSLAQKEDVLRRWSESNAVAIEVLSKHPEVIGFTALIFGEDAVPKQYLTVK